MKRFRHQRSLCSKFIGRIRLSNKSRERYPPCSESARQRSRRLSDILIIAKKNCKSQGRFKNVDSMRMYIPKQKCDSK